MAFITRAFDLFYKRLGPTGSNNSTGNPIYRGYLPEDWFLQNGTFPDISQSFINFPDDSDFNPEAYYINTRDNTADNATYQAIPWGSAAGDFLWNIKTPSWSYSDVSETYGGDNYVVRYWTNTYVTKSFNKQFQRNGSTFGVDSYNVNSSWFVFDPKLQNASASLHYIHRKNGSSAYPTYVGSLYNATGSELSNSIAYSMTYPNVTASNATSSIDGQYFDQGGGAAITRDSIMRSLLTESISGSNSSELSMFYRNQALKARRLYFPVTVSGSGTPGGTDYWFKEYTGYKITDIFNENGGIYNIQLTLKRHVASDCYPDPGSFMTAFIHNIAPTMPATTAQRFPGADGWYPPANNIVTIGNGLGGGSQMSFYDVLTGYQIEKFNFNLIQYGPVAQLCFEVSGSLADNSYFGIIIDDLQICKVGVTTDPRFIKPTTIAQAINYQDYRDLIFMDPIGGTGGFIPIEDTGSWDPGFYG